MDDSDVGSEASFDFDVEQNDSATSPTNGTLSQTNGAGNDHSDGSDSGDGDSADDALSEEDSQPLPDSLRSAFQMQCDELVDNISPQHTAEEKRAQKLIATIKRVIGETPAHEPLPVRQPGLSSGYEKTLTQSQVAQAISRFSKSHKVKIPFSRPRPAGDAKYSLGYSKPVDISVVGSHAIRTTVTLDNTRCIDLAVSMPPVRFRRCYMEYGSNVSTIAGAVYGKRLPEPSVLS